MKFLTPMHWYQRVVRRPYALRLISLPVSWIWARLTAGRISRATPADPGIPVICVGNLTLGGSGKTPVARELTRRLRTKGIEAHVLIRGHGGQSAGPIRVDPKRHQATDVGDEALMLARDLPVWVARDRLAGVRMAADAGAALVIMDDGHQNPAVLKAASIVVVDGETRDGEWPFGDGAVFPAGPMREPLAAGLQRADGVIILLPFDLARADPVLVALFAARPVLTAHLVPTSPPPAGPQLGFAGIGKPWKMERALKAAGCELVDFAPLADHQFLTERLLQFLANRAHAWGAGLISSEKDWMRLPNTWRDRVTPWSQRVAFDDEAALDELLAPVVAQARQFKSLRDVGPEPDPPQIARV